MQSALRCIVCSSSLTLAVERPAINTPFLELCPPYRRNDQGIAAHRNLLSNHKMFPKHHSERTDHEHAQNNSQMIESVCVCVSAFMRYTVASRLSLSGGLEFLVSECIAYLLMMCAFHEQHEHNSNTRTRGYYQPLGDVRQWCVRVSGRIKRTAAAAAAPPARAGPAGIPQSKQRRIVAPDVYNKAGDRNGGPSSGGGVVCFCVAD